MGILSMSRNFVEWGSLYLRHELSMRYFMPLLEIGRRIYTALAIEFSKTSLE